MAETDDDSDVESRPGTDVSPGHEHAKESILGAKIRAGTEGSPASFAGMGKGPLGTDTTDTGIAEGLAGAGTGIGADTFDAGEEAGINPQEPEGSKDIGAVGTAGETFSGEDAKKYLKGAKFPARREDLVIYARDKGAPEEFISFLEVLPDRDYHDWIDVSYEF